jgi:FtsH-binding integral membrane protein
MQKSSRQVKELLFNLIILGLIILYLSYNHIYLRIDFGGKSIWVITLGMMFGLGQLGSFLIKDENKKTKFALKFYSTIILGLVAGIISALYFESKIEDLAYHLDTILSLMITLFLFTLIEINRSED